MIPIAIVGISVAIALDLRLHSLLLQKVLSPNDSRTPSIRRRLPPPALDLPRPGCRISHARRPYRRAPPNDSVRHAYQISGIQ